MSTISYAGYRFPREFIQHAVWIYLRFTLSYRDVEELLPSAASTYPTRPSDDG
jgi:putative transposase